MPAWNSDRDVKLAFDAVKVGIASAAAVQLHPDTAPDAVARAQRRVIREAVPRVGTDPKALSLEVCLPVWTVERRLAEITRTRVRSWTPADKLAACAAAVRVFMRRRAGKPPVTAGQVAKALSLPRTTVQSALEQGGYRREQVPVRRRRVIFQAVAWSQPAVA